MKEALNASLDAIFDENRFSSILRPSLWNPNGTEDIGDSVVSKEVTKEVVTQQPEPELRKCKRNRTSKDFGPGFQLYLIEGTRDEGFKQKSWIDYFDTYPLVACISTIRLLIAMASIHNLIIHQMDVKTTFLNGDLDEEIYMNQPQGFIMPGNENKVRKLIKSLCRLKQKTKKRTKSDQNRTKNGKRGEAGKSLKQLQLKEEEKPKKTKKEWPKTHTRIKSYATLKKRRKEKGT
nr:zinc finger, CCHC-type [Tanacetum cinerariifolium]